MKKQTKVFSYILIGTAIIIFVASSNTYLGRYIRWNFPDVYDLSKFPFIPIHQPGEPQQLVESLEPTLTAMNVKHEGETVPLQELLLQSKTRAFLVLRNDTLIQENYPLGDNRETLFKSYSMTKSVFINVDWYCHSRQKNRERE